MIVIVEHTPEPNLTTADDLNPAFPINEGSTVIPIVSGP